MKVHRFLLDQNFPNPTFALDELDATVQFTHLSTFDRRLSDESTPDWVVYLAAAAAGFDGAVTRDLAQLKEEDSIVVLSQVDLTMITWAQPIEDAITEWAQLLAFMPEIKKKLGERRRQIICYPHRGSGPNKSSEHPISWASERRLIGRQLVRFGQRP